MIANMHGVFTTFLALTYMITFNTIIFLGGSTASMRTRHLESFEQMMYVSSLSCFTRFCHHLVDLLCLLWKRIEQAYFLLTRQFLFP